MVKLLAQNAISAALTLLITIIKQQAVLIQRNKLKPNAFAVDAAKPSIAFYNEAIASRHKDYVLQHREKEAQALAKRAARRAERNAETAYIFGRNGCKREGKSGKKGDEGFNWVTHNSRATGQELSRLEHLMAMLEAEQVKETKREIAFYERSLPPRQQEYVRRKVARSRANAADTIMETLVDYGLVSIVTYANYLKSIPKQPCLVKLNGKLRKVPTHLPKKRCSGKSSRPSGTSSGHYQGRNPVGAKANTKPRKQLQLDEESGVFELRRRSKESTAKRSPSIGTTVQTAEQSSSSLPLEADSMGGWGTRISYEGERIVEQQKTKLAGFEQDACPVYKMDYTTAQYSFILHRPMAKRIGQ